MYASRWAPQANRVLEATVIVVLLALVLVGCHRPGKPIKIINVPTEYLTIQAAIDAAQNGDEVVVAQGRYKENIDFKGKAITVRSTDPADRTVVAATIIDGDNRGSVVTFRSGEKAASVLKGFTITNGSGTRVLGDGGLHTRYGGGICCKASSPTIKSNTISGNSATGENGGSGGGVCCYDFSSPILTNNTIRANSASSGGGVYCENSSPTLGNSTITGNEANLGGGVSCKFSSPVLVSNTISGNKAAFGNGGGVYCTDCRSLTLTGNTISGNMAGWGGGVCCTWNSSPALTNNTISGNSATFGGGGVYCKFSSSPTIMNTIVAFNTGGGGLLVDKYSDPSNPLVTHCDFYGNADGNHLGWPDQTGKNGNISQDPLFHDLAGDFHLRSKGGRWDPVTNTWVVDTVHSPCIDAGDPKSAFDQEPAPNGGRVNMGAYGNTPEGSKSAPAG